MAEEEVEVQEVEEAVETEMVEEQTETTAEVEEAAEEQEEVVEEVVEEEPTMVPVAALKDERGKRQALEDELKGYKDGVAAVQKQQPEAAPATLEEAFDRDPKGVVRDLNLEIRRLRDEDGIGNANDIDTLLDRKADLRNREFQNLQQQMNQQTSVQKVLATVTREIPDFNAKLPILEAFAVQELDYTLEEFRQRTAPEHGDMAAKEFIRVNKLYDRLNAKPQAKVVKAKATKVEGAGKGVSSAGPDLNTLKEQAMSSGDWTNYFDAMGMLEE
jgi:hypothetical protein